jgi:hypothetical protein
MCTSVPDWNSYVNPQRRSTDQLRFAIADFMKTHREEVLERILTLVASNTSLDLSARIVELRKTIKDVRVIPFKEAAIPAKRSELLAFLAGTWNDTTALKVALSQTRVFLYPEGGRRRRRLTPDERQLVEQYRVARIRTHSRPVLAVDSNTGQWRLFASTRAAQDRGFASSNIVAVALGRRRASYGYRWFYVDTLPELHAPSPFVRVTRDERSPVPPGRSPRRPTA